MNETAQANAAGAVVGTGDQRLQCWNETTILFPEDHRLHQLFTRQVQRTPKAVAAVYEDARLTYVELDARSNQLANYLRSLGVGPDVLVGVAMERSLDLSVEQESKPTGRNASSHFRRSLVAAGRLENQHETETVPEY